MLDGYALPPSGSTDRLPEDFSSPVRRLRAEWAYARAAAGMEDDILVPTLVDELFALGETQKAEHLIARAWPAVFSALLSFLQPEERTLAKDRARRRLPNGAEPYCVSAKTPP